MNFIKQLFFRPEKKQYEKIKVSIILWVLCFSIIKWNFYIISSQDKKERKKKSVS